jgi:uncharacterized protein YjbJ (UPF0337 family)
VGLRDKISGRVKKAAGELKDDPSLKRQGRRDEEKAQAKDDLARAQDDAALKAQEVADLERKT